jgi:hypothetical protein
MTASRRGHGPASDPDLLASAGLRRNIPSIAAMSTSPAGTATPSATCGGASLTGLFPVVPQRYDWGYRNV